MITVEFTSVLKNFFPTLRTEYLEAGDLQSLVEAMDRKYPGFSNYITEDTGNLREHVHIYIGDIPIRRGSDLREKLAPSDKVFIFQAISGG
ncbi:MAG: MoaD/ThiS family protein [Cyclobacteriaceae bacterium]|nr:MoaD/ThiS family protein [Cyclobacteriaceae bacterium]